ncbi:MAG: prepilin-type N-terminal cleavage/methylation domain-containing protein [Bryobacteraceae bacterium]|nr:prepilin-type N-terminal cleavage/methylation domain-containing protein [Bryobacteraceae bacterium]
MRPRPREAGITLLEMLVVVTLIGLLAGISYPSVAAGLETLRLTQACDTVASLLNGALNRAERRQEAVEIEIARAARTVTLRGALPGFTRSFTLPDGVSIDRVLPAQSEPDEDTRRFLVYPNGTTPRIAIELSNARGSKRRVRLDPITGVPQVERL